MRNKPPSSKKFNEEMLSCKEVGAMTEKMGGYVLDIIHNEVFDGAILRGWNDTVKTEIYDVIITYAVEKWDKVMKSNTPKAYLYALVRNRTRNFKERTLLAKSSDIYGKSLLMHKTPENAWVKANVKQYGFVNLEG